MIRQGRVCYLVVLYARLLSSGAAAQLSTAQLAGRVITSVAGTPRVMQVGIKFRIG